MSLRYGSFLALGGPPGRAFRGVLSCPSVRWGGLPGRASGKILATLVLEIAQPYIYISACACVGFVWPHSLRTLTKVGELASKITARDQGPFPLFHVDFGHNNIVVDDDYNVLGVIDWEHACSVPVPMTPDNYNENGTPKDLSISIVIGEQKTYIDTVQSIEQNKGLAPILSATLANQASQDLASAMKLYAEDGICGRYTDALRVHQETTVGREEVRNCDGAGDSKVFRGDAH